MMCVKQKRFERRHPRRTHCRLKPVERGTISVPTVLAIIAAEAADVFGEEGFIGVTRIPHLYPQADSELDGTAEVLLDGGDLQALHKQRKREQSRQIREFAERHPLAPQPIAA